MSDNSAGVLITASCVVLGVLSVLLLAPSAQAHLDVTLALKAPAASQLWLLAAVFVAGCSASLIPGWRAHRLPPVNGLLPRV